MAVLCWSSCEEIPHSQGKRNPSKMVGVARGHQRADTLKPYSQKTKIMASGPITSWEIDGVTVETVSDFISLGSKITGDGDCSHEIKRCLFPGRKAMTNLDNIIKSRDITLPTKVRPSSQGYGFSSSHVWM